MPRILIATFGSYGDLHPYLAIGRELTRRGHRVTIATSAGYREKIEAEGLALTPVRPDILLDDRAFLASFFDRKRGSEAVIRWIASAARDTYADLLPAAQQADLMVTHLATFVAVAVAEKLKKPWVSTVLAPCSFLSAYDPPVIAVAPWLTHFRFLGPAFMRRIWEVGRRQTRGWLEPVLELRRELGLETRENPLFEGANSPDRVLALFSGALAEPAQDWPEQTVLTGFCFHDHGGDWAGRDEFERFISAGKPPVLFTLGSSAVAAAQDFYRQSATAVMRLGARAVFLTGPVPQDLPDPLPPNILCLEYAPHAAVMSRASVVVHQGGVGTTGEAMRSGRPALVVPFAHDQYDNAARVQRAGIGETIPRERYSAGAAVKALGKLLAHPAYEIEAAKVMARICSETGPQTAANAIEEAIP